jgi:uncharacterized membrane protein
MSEPYNRFTGQSLEHLTALSDGLFAVAMTLLVLDLRVPVSTAGTVYTEHGLGRALLDMGPSFAAYLLSFTMPGTFRRRILLAQTLYALAALICLISTMASVIALALVQLYFIVSPRLPRRPDPAA